MRRLNFRLEGLPKSMNGSHGNWRAAAGMRKHWRKKSFDIAWKLLAASGDKRPFEKVFLTCVRRSFRPMDYDNNVASMKAIIDGLKDAGVIVDDCDRVIVRREYRWEPAPMKAGHVEITVEETSAV